MDTDTKPPVTIIREPEDPICTRVSLGGRPDMVYYIVYRGTVKDVDALLRRCLEAFQQVPRPQTDA